MIIVLNNKEVQSFRKFMCEYVNTCAKAIRDTDIVDKEYFLRELEGKSTEELVDKMFSEIDMNPLVKVIDSNSNSNGMSFSIDSDIFVAYNEYMRSSMVILRPYSVKVASIVCKYRECITKAREMVSSKIALGLVRGACAFLGLSELYNELSNVANEFKDDELGFQAMNRIKTNLRDRFEVVKIMNDYLNN